MRTLIELPEMYVLISRYPNNFCASFLQVECLIQDQLLFFSSSLPYVNIFILFSESLDFNSWRWYFGFVANGSQPYIGLSPPCYSSN